MILLLTIFIFLLLSAFFSGSEMAYLSASKLRVEVQREKGTRRGKIIAGFYDFPKRLLSTLLIGNNIALVIFTFLMTKLLNGLYQSVFGDGVLLLIFNTLIITVIVLIFGEFLPKTFSRLYASKTLNFLAYPLNFFKYLLWLPATIINGISDGILKLVFKKSLDAGHVNLSRIDLEHYIEDNIKEDDDDIDKDLFTNALKLDKLKVRDCMIPRTEIVYTDIKDSIADHIRIFKESTHSRILVIDDDIEEVHGYIHHQQLIDNPKSIKDQVLEIPFVPEAMNVKDLMQEFIGNDNNIACVVDEFGGTAGLITLEDILEEIFGEIEDEHDHEDLLERYISSNEFLLSGRLEIDHLNEKYTEINIPEGEYHTLSGYITITSGTIPNEGDIIELDGYRCILEKVSDTKIEEVRLFIEEKDESPQSA